MKRKVLAFFLGVVTALVVLEVGLRLVGLGCGVTARVDRGTPAFRDKSAYVILCLGNSYTKGVGASSGMSYPEQLQHLFEKQALGTSVQVINKGKIAENTTELLTHLPRDLDAFAPDLVVLQTGQPNGWIFTGYDDHLKRKRASGGRGLSWRERFADALSHSRIYRLFLLWRQAVQQKNEKAWFSLEEYAKRRGDADYARAAEFVKEINFPFREIKKEDIGSAYIENVRSVLKKAAIKDPGYPFNYVYIGDTYRFEGEYEEAVRWYRKSLEVDTRTRDGNEYHTGYQAIRQIKKRLKNHGYERLEKQIDDFILKFRKEHPREAVNFFLLRDEEIAQWTASDLEEILEELAGRRIPVIIQNYPVSTNANGVLREIAERHKVPFVDNKKVFDEKLASGVRKEALFVPDEHCNDAGYGLMAENVYQKIIEEDFLIRKEH